MRGREEGEDLCCEKGERERSEELVLWERIGWEREWGVLLCCGKRWEGERGRRMLWEGRGG